MHTRPNLTLVVTRTHLSLAASLLLTGLFSGRAAAQAPVYSGTLRGELIVTGNTLGLDAETGTAPGVGGSIGTFIANPLTSSQLQEGTYPVGTTADYNLNGSAAELDLPAGASVVKAELVWACSSQSAGLPATPATTPAAVNLTLPGGTQQTVSPSGETTALTLLTTNFKYYQRWADVTGAVGVGGAGRYTVSRVVGTQFMDQNYVTGCGWALYVVYAHPDLPMRNINLWVIGQEVRDDDNAVCPCEAEIEVSGFCTPSEEGAALGRMVVTALEGDARFTDDQLLIADPFAPGEFYPLSGPNNAYDNFFASQINGEDGLLDTRGTFGTRNHELTIANDFTSQVELVVGARQGWDIATIPLNDSEQNPFVLENGQSSTTLIATTGGVDTEGDDYIISAIGLALDFASPDLAGIHETSHEVTWIGDELTFTVMLVNEGSGAADDVAFCYQATSNTTFQALSIDGTPKNGVQAAQLAPSNCTAAVGGVSIGAFEPGQQRVVTLRYKVDSLVAAPNTLDKVTTTPSWRLEWRPPCQGADKELDRQTGETIDVPGVLLQATLTVSPTGLAVADDVLTYTLTISNIGSGDAPDGVVARLPIPVGTVYVAGSTTLNGAAVADAGGTMPFVAAREVGSPGEPTGVIAAGESAVIVFRVRITDDASATVSETGFFDGDGARTTQPERPSNTVLTQVDGGPPDSDQDEDGILDGDDNCVLTWNPLQENNYDTRGYNPSAVDEGDACDDTDGDGLFDVEEDPDFDGPEATQTDATKPDTDGDGLCDGSKQVGLCIGVEDRDGDKDPLDWGIRETNPIDADTDDDGICDGAKAGGACLGGEATQNSDPLKTDSDGDGLCDGPGGGAWDLSRCIGSEPGADGVYQAGTDTDPSNSDSDDDKLCDGFENGATDCERGEDTDGDRDPGDYNGIDDPETNPLDKDTDDGGVDDGTEVLVQDTNPRDRCDGDLVNCEEGDADQDGIPDSTDNCPFVANPLQEDRYPPPVGNGIGDACDDVDQDGIKDRDEDIGPDGIPQNGDETDPQDPDTDGDGLCDGAIKIDPCVGFEDTDGDFDPADRGTTETSPTNPDTDGDRLCDGIGAGGNCLGGEQITLTNPLDTDSDDDGLCDGPGGGGWDQSGCLGSETGTDGLYDQGIDTLPNDPDSDDDTLCDGFNNGSTGCRDGEDKDGDRDVGDFDQPGDAETDPLNPDTDRGGVSDGVEFDNRTNPRDACDGDNQVCAAALVVEGGGCAGGAGGGLGLMLAGLGLVIARRFTRV